MALPSFSLDFERFHRLPARCSKLGRYYLFACARSLAVDGYEIERKAVTGAQIELMREREQLVVSNGIHWFDGSPSRLRNKAHKQTSTRAKLHRTRQQP